MTTGGATGAGSGDRLVRTEVRAGVATVTLDSVANRNALSRRLLVELGDALGRLAAEPGVRVLVLTGAGPVFCSGADLKEQRDGGGPGPVGMADVMGLLLGCPRPVVARVNGPARAGGLGLLAACDIAVGPAAATFAFSEVRIGVVPAVISVPCLLRMDRRAAHEYFLTGEAFDGSRAQEIGLLDRAVPDGALDDTVARYVDLLVRGAPEALAHTKEVLRVVPGLDVGRALSRMAELSADRFGSAEGREGIAAFRDRRDPAWLPPDRRSGPA